MDTMHPTVPTDPIGPEVEIGKGPGNTRPAQASPRINWFFTWNNYSEDDVKSIQVWADLHCNKAVIGREVGEEGTPHLQGCLELKRKMRFTALKKLWPKVHWEETWNPERAQVYCRKEGNLAVDFGGAVKAKDPLAGKTLRDWQAVLLEEVSGEPDDRTIRWVWDAAGCTGKTTFAKHLCITRPREVLFLSGKGADVKYGVQAVMSAPRPWAPKVCIFHFTRSVEDYVSYEAIEAVKDGIFFSTKYESGMVVFDTPHVICLANFPPDINKMSLDRWKVTDIGAKDNEDVSIDIDELDDILAAF